MEFSSSKWIIAIASSTHRPSFGCSNRRLSSAVDATLPVMKHIELRLDTQVGLSGLENSVVQYCVGVVFR